MRRLSLAVGLVMLVMLLSACLVSSGYAVRSDVVIEDAGRRLAQSLYVTCTAIRSPNAAGVQVMAVGWRHWFVRQDGSILILGDLQPCRGSPAALGAAERPFVQGYYAFPGVGARNSWLFDSATRPTRAEVYDTGSLFQEGPFRIVRVDTAPAWRPPSSGLAEAFPGLASLTQVDNAAFTSDIRAPAGSQLQPKSMTGWVAQAYLVRGVPPCGDPRAMLMALDPQDACARLPPCSAGDVEPCAAPKGYLRLLPSADFVSFSIASAEPEPAYIGALYTPATLVQNHADLFEGWSPRFCYQGACEEITSGLPFRGDLYLPRERELVRISRISMMVQPNQFRIGLAFAPNRRTRPLALPPIRPRPLLGL